MSKIGQVLFLQGGGKGAFEVDKALAQSLRDALGTEYTLQYPPMPREDDPDYALWCREIERELDTLGEGVVLVAHSVGAFISLKFLVERSIETRLAGVFLIATPFVGSGGWDIEGMAMPEGFAAKWPEEVPLFLYHARDDAEVPFAHLELYRESMPKAVIRVFEVGGHQLNNDLSQVAADIRGAVGGVVDKT